MTARIASALLLAGSLLACTTTYVGDPGPPEVSENAPNCDVDNTRPGCAPERPMCQVSTEYLCDPL